MNNRCDTSNIFSTVISGYLLRAMYLPPSISFVWYVLGSFFVCLSRYIQSVFNCKAEKYLQYREYHKAYKQTNPKKKEEYAERYRTELALYDRAERYLKEHLGSDTKLRPKAWRAEVTDLTAQKDRLYREMRSLKEEAAEAETVKRCVEQAIPPTEQRKEKSKTHDMSL